MKPKTIKIIITATPKYGRYLSTHLQKEHPSTKGKVKLK
jgi:hypothetical protein